MIDLPVNDMPMNHEYVRQEAQQAVIEEGYQLMEIDLSFSNALAGLCSGGASSGPIDRRKATKNSG